MKRTQEQTARAIFQIKSAEETPFSEAPGAPKLSRGHYVLAYQGDLRGEGILEELKVQFSEKRASMSGLQRFTGELGDLSGTFAMSHTGKFINGVVTAKCTVIPASATGGLKGLRGEMTLQAIPGKEFTLTFHYRFA